MAFEKEKRQRGKQKMKRRIVAVLCTVFCLAFLIPSAIPAFAVGAGREVIVGGSLFGVRMHTDGVLIVGLDKVTPRDGEAPRAPAYDCGIRLKDIITEIDGKPVKDSSTVTNAIRDCKGNAITVKIKRGDTPKYFTLIPAKDKEGNYRAGIWIRDAAAGIGTVTYVDPKTGEFAGLGHGICDGETGTVLPIKRGAVSEVQLLGVVKGQKGIPGELKGTVSNAKSGALIKNTRCGVYGLFSAIPSQLCERMKVAGKQEIKEGAAPLRCAADGTVKDYEVNISKIDIDEDIKNFVVTVTDKRLLELTGGIVQGMSGSPIIQDGKLVGAVTHVLINDPTAGYGIFIENMLNAAQMPMAKAS